MIDLHQHSTYSDGTDDILSIVKLNKAKCVDIMALSDHDTIDGCKKLAKFKNKFGIKFIPAIEFSTTDKGDSIHILAYGYDFNDETINYIIEKSKQLRIDRINKRIELLKTEFNIQLTNADLKKIYSSNNPNKVLLSNILIKKGYGSTVGEVIKKYLYHKLSESKLSTRQVIMALKKSSAISTFAHGLGGVGEKRVTKTVFEERLKRFKSYGLKALECFYALYTQNEQMYLSKMANKFNLLKSGGSDYHGKVKDVKIGEISCDGFKADASNFTIIDKIKNIYFI